MILTLQVWGENVEESLNGFTLASERGLAAPFPKDGLSVAGTVGGRIEASFPAGLQQKQLDVQVQKLSDEDIDSLVFADDARELLRRLQGMYPTKQVSLYRAGVSEGGIAYRLTASVQGADIAVPFTVACFQAGCFAFAFFVQDAYDPTSLATPYIPRFSGGVTYQHYVAAVSDGGEEISASADGLYLLAPDGSIAANSVLIKRDSCSGFVVRFAQLPGTLTLADFDSSIGFTPGSAKLGDGNALADFLLSPLDTQSVGSVFFFENRDVGFPSVQLPDGSTDLFCAPL